MMRARLRDGADRRGGEQRDSAEARANLNVRLLPGDTIDRVLNDLNKLVNDRR